MPSDLARGHRDDLVIEPLEPPLVLGNQLRSEARLPVARHINVDLAGVDHRRLATVAIAAASGLLITAQMAIHLGIERAFGQALLQRIQQSAPIQRGRRSHVTGVR